MMATITFADGSEEFTDDLHGLAAADWSHIDRVELHVDGLVLESRNPADFQRDVSRLADVLQLA